MVNSHSGVFLFLMFGEAARFCRLLALSVSELSSGIISSHNKLELNLHTTYMIIYSLSYFLSLFYCKYFSLFIFLTLSSPAPGFTLCVQSSGKTSIFPPFCQFLKIICLFSSFFISFDFNKERDFSCSVFCCCYFYIPVNILPLRHTPFVIIK